MATLSVSLPVAMREWIDAQVQAGEYGSASHYIRDLIRQDQQGRASVRLALIEGEKSALSLRTVSEIAVRARQRLKRA